MVGLLRSLWHEVGTGRALVNASDERAREALVLVRIDALARRVEHTAARAPERRAANA